MYRLRAVILWSALESDARVPDLDLFCVSILKLACLFNDCRQDSAKYRHSEKIFNYKGVKNTLQNNNNNYKELHLSYFFGKKKQI